MGWDSSFLIINVGIGCSLDLVGNLSINLFYEGNVLLCLKNQIWNTKLVTRPDWNLYVNWSIDLNTLSILRLSMRSNLLLHHSRNIFCLRHDHVSTSRTILLHWWSLGRFRTKSVETNPISTGRTVRIPICYLRLNIIWNFDRAEAIISFILIIGRNEGLIIEDEKRLHQKQFGVILLLD